MSNVRKTKQDCAVKETKVCRNPETLNWNCRKTKRIDASSLHFCSFLNEMPVRCLYNQIRYLHSYQKRNTAIRRCFLFLFRKRLRLCSRVMRPASAARWELRPPAAGGRSREGAITAAVEKSEEKRKPERFFGHRKAARSDNPEVVGSNPSPATIKST